MIGKRVKHALLWSCGVPFYEDISLKLHICCRPEPDADGEGQEAEEKDPVERQQPHPELVDQHEPRRRKAVQGPLEGCDQLQSTGRQARGSSET